MKPKAKRPEALTNATVEKLRNTIRELEDVLYRAQKNNEEIRDMLKREQVTVRALQYEVVRLERALDEATSIPF